MACIFGGCSHFESSYDKKLKKANASIEPISKSSEAKAYPVFELVSQERSPYSWENKVAGQYPLITKEMFRCKGSYKHPHRNKIGQFNETIIDCEGGHKHSLPVAGGKEFVYPILLDLLNYIQDKTQHRVIITCGHRCPAHNTYADESIYNLSSKHMIGGEVDFYVKGMEDKPEVIVSLVQDYYKEIKVYQSQNEYQRFQRLDQSKVNISTDPWYNKEILIKLYKSFEGRDFDNQHPHPYLSIQVRYDRDKQERVLYSWEKAFHSFMRY